VNCYDPNGYPALCCGDQSPYGEKCERWRGHAGFHVYRTAAFYSTWAYDKGGSVAFYNREEDVYPPSRSRAIS
jgi:hypothetical protein